MEFGPEHDQLRQVIRQLVEREINPYVDVWEEARRLPAHELFKKFGEVGAFGLEYDPAFGGGGVDHSFTVVVAEEIGRVDAGGVSTALSVQAAMATPALARFGSD
ncbi:MAG: acyl-CoA dehydrogenase family protein, partial [Actinomycetales bacterium]